MENMYLKSYLINKRTFQITTLILLNIKKQAFQKLQGIEEKSSSMQRRMSELPNVRVDRNEIFCVNDSPMKM